MKKRNLVAVYGSLLSGLGNHHWMKALGEEHYELKGEVTLETGFELFPLGGYPGIQEGDHPLVVEVYAVTDELLRGPLDGLEGYTEGRTPTFYDRRTIDTPFGKTFIYYFVRGREGRPIIEDGNWRKYITSK